VGDGGGAAGDLQPFVDVLQVGVHGSLGDAQAAGDLPVGVPCGMPGWQIALIAAGAALLAATVAVVLYRAWVTRRKPLTATA